MLGAVLIKALPPSVFLRSTPKSKVTGHGRQPRLPRRILAKVFNQAANPRRRKSRFINGGGVLTDLMPRFAPSLFTTKKPKSTERRAAPRNPRPVLSKFFNKVAQTRRKVSRFIGGRGALTPPLPTFPSSRFFSKPRPPPDPNRRKEVRRPRDHFPKPPG